jgi:carboxymethylenebutenolidase
MISVQRSEITLNTDGKPLNVYLASPSGGSPGVLVLPSWWGLKPFFRQVCDRLAAQGYTALALDYYQGQVASTIAEAQKLQQMVEGDMEVMSAMVGSAKDYLASLRKGKPIILMGFSMGTDWSILTAAKEPDVAALVLFYGFYNVDLSRTRPKVLGHFAEKDEYNSLDGVREMEQDLKDAGVEVTFHIYPGVSHWFMEEDRPEYDPGAAKLAWERTLEFLKENAAW